jgi:hypothetical protein
MTDFFVPFRAWAGSRAKRQIQLTAAYHCEIVTGVKSPANAMFEHTNTRYPQVIARRMLLSCELRNPMENRHPSISVARSRTPKTFTPSGGIAYSSWTTPMWRNPSVSTKACTISWCGIGRCVSVAGGVGTSVNSSAADPPAAVANERTSF